LFSSAPILGNVLSVNGYTGTVVLTYTDVDADPLGAAYTAQENAEIFTTDAINDLVLPQTFAPVDAGSPPEPAEFLTGYDAGTGLFSASALAPTSATMTFIATVEYPGTVGFLTDATYAAPYFATTDPTSVTIMGSKSLTITLGSMGNTTTLAALDLSGLTDLQNFTYREGA